MTCEIVNQSINVLGQLGVPVINQSMYWGPHTQEVQISEFIQTRFAACKSFPDETITCVWFTQSHKVCNGTTVLQEV